MGDGTGVQWFYAANNERRGPVSEAELETAIVAGQVTATTLVWCEGMPAWVAAGETALARHFATLVTAPVAPAGAIPPPPPPAMLSSSATPLRSPVVVHDRRSSTLAAQGPTAVTNAPLAIASLAMGIGGFVICLGLGIGAVICGHMARKQIAESQGSLSGGGLALAGLILGYFQIALMIAIVIGVVILMSLGMLDAAKH